MTYPDKHRSIALLQEWKEHHEAAEKVMDGIKASVGLDPHGPLFDMVWRMFDGYTLALGKALGDDFGTWLAWYYMENDMGREGMHAGYDGQLAPIKTLEQLHELIAEGHKRGEVQP